MYTKDRHVALRLGMSGVGQELGVRRSNGTTKQAQEQDGSLLFTYHWQMIKQLFCTDSVNLTIEECLSDPLLARSNDSTLHFGLHDRFSCMRRMRNQESEQQRRTSICYESSSLSFERPGLPMPRPNTPWPL